MQGFQLAISDRMLLAIIYRACRLVLFYEIECKILYTGAEHAHRCRVVKKTKIFVVITFIAFYINCSGHRKRSLISDHAPIHYQLVSRVYRSNPMKIISITKHLTNDVLFCEFITCATARSMARRRNVIFECT